MQAYFDKNKNVYYKKVLPIKFVSDERFCDGYYFIRSLNMLQKMLNNPNVLLKELEESPLSRIDKKLLKQGKQI